MDRNRITPFTPPLAYSEADIQGLLRQLTDSDQAAAWMREAVQQAIFVIRDQHKTICDLRETIARLHEAAR